MHKKKKRERDSYSSAPTYQKINTIFMSVLFFLSLSLSVLTHFSPSQNDKNNVIGIIITTIYNACIIVYDSSLNTFCWNSITKYIHIYINANTLQVRHLLFLLYLYQDEIKERNDIGRKKPLDKRVVKYHQPFFFEDRSSEL